MTYERDFHLIFSLFFVFLQFPVSTLADWLTTEIPSCAVYAVWLRNIFYINTVISPQYVSILAITYLNKPYHMTESISKAFPEPQELGSSWKVTLERTEEDHFRAQKQARAQVVVCSIFSFVEGVGFYKF